MTSPFVNTRFVKERLEATLPSVIRVFRAGDIDLKTSFGQVFPAVYILRQMFNAPAPGGSSQVYRQTFDNHLEIAVVARRYQDGLAEGEEARFALCNEVLNSLHGFSIPGTSLALDLSSYSDGDPADTINYGILRFHTRVLYQKVTTP